MLFKGIVYVEEAVLNHYNTVNILAKLNHPQVVTINHYKDVFNQPSAEWRTQKQAQKIILAQRKSPFYYKGSEVTPSFGYANFYYNTLALNCIYDCDYCYLQGLFTSAHMVLFVNNEDFITETKTLINQLNSPVYLALSYDTDLLAIENWFNYCEQWINYAATEPNLLIEIRTKSGNFKSIKHIKPNNQVLLAWTLSPQEVINLHEPQTPNLNVRLNALKEAVSHGWRVRVCIDPILRIPNWEQAYAGLIDQLANTVNLKQLDSISVGVFRTNKEFLKRMQKQRKDTPVLYYPYTANQDVISYNPSQKNEMIEAVVYNIKALDKHINVAII